jgi:hypothetical protein
MNRIFLISGGTRTERLTIVAQLCAQEKRLGIECPLYHQDDESILIMASDELFIENFEQAKELTRKPVKRLSKDQEKPLLRANIVVKKIDATTFRKIPDESFFNQRPRAPSVEPETTSSRCCCLM